MPLPTGYMRVTKRNPCPVCDKPDWCLVSRDGKYALCPRRISKDDWGEAGYRHELDNVGQPAAAFQETEIKTAPINAAAISRECQLNMTHARRDEVVQETGLGWESLSRLDIGYHERYLAFTFPMRNWQGRVIGIRLRRTSGFKFAVPGSRNGLFIPQDVPKLGDVFVCEGPTDTAAVASLGLATIGRPFCKGGVVDLVHWFRNSKRSAVIVSDADGAGVDGAISLAHELFGVVPVRVIRPVLAKDAREMVVRNGATAGVFLAVADNTPLFKGVA